MEKVMMSDIDHQFHCERCAEAEECPRLPRSRRQVKKALEKNLDNYNSGDYVSLNFTLYDRIGGSNKQKE